jgi:hypothetical protein
VSSDTREIDPPMIPLRSYREVNADRLRYDIVVGVLVKAAGSLLSGNSFGDRTLEAQQAMRLVSLALRLADVAIREMYGVEP